MEPRLRRPRLRATPLLAIAALLASAALLAAACTPPPLSTSAATGHVVPPPNTAPPPAQTGSLPVIAPPAAPACAPRQAYVSPVNPPCGNGKIDDTGPVCAPCPANSPHCPCAQGREICDGSDVGAHRCEELGYAGGKLQCYSNCSGLRTDECESCLPGRKCASLLLAEKVSHFATAARREDIGVAWVEVAEGCERARFARVGVDGKVRSLSPAITEARGLALAATSRGWLLATAVSGGVSTWAIEANGDVVGPVAHVQYGEIATLTGGTAGGPALLTLLTRSAAGGTTVHATLLSDAGEVVVSPSAVLEDVYPGPMGQATRAPGGFLVSAGRPLKAGPADAGVSLRRIGDDGALGPVQPLTGVKVDQAYTLGWSGAAGSLVAQSREGEYDIVPLDRDGRATGPAKHLSVPGTFAGAFDLESQTMLAHGGSQGQAPLALVRLDRTSPQTTSLARDGASLGHALHSVAGEHVALWLSVRSQSARLMLTEVP